ncbi:MAG: HD domain-containing protein [Ruminococcus sp.]|nr:HD domain-containing protein [Ruminococcus sp.]
MLDELMALCRKLFTEEEVKLIEKAYLYADIAHKGKKRQSGEAYIIHPIHVAYYVLTKYNLIDSSSICAALLHDTIEDTNVTYEDLVREFNFDIANLVLSVTNCNNISFKDKNEEEKFNNAAILRNMLQDIRTIIIKSADRLHNMETLEYKLPESRLRKSTQTFCFYVPLDYAIGANRPAKELENLCFKFLHPEEYTHTVKIKRDFEDKYCSYLISMSIKLKEILASSGIVFDYSVHMEDIYDIYKGLNKHHKLSKIPGLMVASITLDSEEDCYRVLELLKENYKTYDISDDLVTTNLDGYHAISLNIKGFKNYFLRVEIFTRDMELFNSYGYAAIINSLKGLGMRDVHKVIRTKSNFFNSLEELGDYYRNNEELIQQAEQELFASKINVVTSDDKIVRLPHGSTVLDFAYFIHSDIGSTAFGALVNNKFVGVDYVLQDNDKVIVKCNPSTIRMPSDAKRVITTRARRRILEHLNL